MNRIQLFFAFFAVAVAVALDITVVATPAGALAPGEAGETGDRRLLTVYCYDSFSSDWGPGPVIAKDFEDQTGIRVEFHAPGDAIAVLNQLILEGADSRADAVIGLDEGLLDRSLAAGILEPYASPALADVDDELIFDPTHHLLPYDYGHFAINYDSALLSDPPSSLEDLTAPRYADKLVLMDPRTSTPGLGFLLWTVSVYEDQWTEYWARLRPSILTVAAGWSEAYALYTAGEAPLVLSYGTSPVYHAEYENTRRYKALEFGEGHPRQIEGMGIVAGTGMREAAEDFIDFMLEPAAQESLARLNIMLPVSRDAELPDSFDEALRPKTVLGLGDLVSDRDINGLVGRWLEVFADK